MTRTIRKVVVWSALAALAVGLTFFGWRAQTTALASSKQRGPGQAVPILPSPHIPYVGAPHAAYNSLPPTSGPHVPQTIAPGVYRQQVPDEIQVHALEHGHVLIQYGPGVPRADVRMLEQVGRLHLNDVVVAPYRQLGGTVALTAFGQLERLDRADRGSVEAFVVTFAGRYNHGWRR
ncbi:MAG TPA: DUF3105 domain-containing protein [Actinomycetes bacterium]|nr:DUF3105 domain-containing protein [Actinomycetes bacterium]